MPSSSAISETSDTPTSAPAQHVLGIPRPPSVGGISSRVTDMASDDGEQSQAYTGVSSHPAQSRASVTRRAPPPARSSITSSSQWTNRPGSSGSRQSRSHIPSLAAQGFFRPMSSQRLQAHRGRPMTKGTTTDTSEDWNDQSSQNRQSLISNSTMPQGSIPPIEQEAPPSRGTEYTDPIIPDRNTSNASPIGNTTGRSQGESAKLIYDKERAYKAQQPHLSMGANYNGSNDPDPSQRSSLSFLSLQNRNQGQDNRDIRTHERLSSAGSTPGSIEKTPQISHGKGRLGKNYEYFVGNTIFFGGGRLQNSRDKPVNIATAIFVIVPSALFFAYSAPWLWHHISPAIPILFAYLFYLCFSSFIHASVVDPGIVPRNLHQMPPPDPTDDPLAIGPPTNDWVMVKLATSDVAAMDVPVKYCKTCCIWRPPRCYHCRVCDNCVETLDHHCVWLNNCVGRRNYRYFFTFVASSTLLALFLLGASLAHILVYRSREHVSFGTAIDKWRVPWAMVIYGAVAAPYPASLWAYHLFLVGRGETTREYLNSHKFAKADRHRPFTQGNIFRNWLSVFLRPRPPTYMQFKQPYHEGDQRLSTMKRKYLPRNVEPQTDIEMQQVPPPSQPQS
ncbi:zf-DHHC-domain-containing protein [Aspergillus sclerotioniger CBS 115572]|uniref:Palmitoyltransferase n=1 Tax=Aspergillus sclerotioniger CBS 115572 TaxID=1450535 RepID=A0A317W0C0_9EURO|nr:zf-DHHC-domain-containing protein [Aspergillus sclerotioniger CBS 115572]PWY79445.1 zf-DHHC-domain-containing protein [Aspergillus sclerotioniger CBS 115572]